MMKQLGIYIAALILMVAVFMTPVGAVNVTTQGGASESQTLQGKASGQSDFATIVKNVINSLFFLIGIVSVIMIIIGGMRLTMAQGDQNAIKQARETVIYASVGLIVALFAFAIVNLVLSQFVK